MMPIFVSADLVTPAGHRFRVKATESLIRIFPGPEMTFNEMMAFYELVVDLIDPDAELVT
jgi:hypothetical protein